MPDGGGPFYTFDGVHRLSGIPMPPSDYLSGCGSKEDLEEYFRKVNNIPDGCKIVEREIPDEYVKISMHELLFPKKFVK